MSNRREFVKKLIGLCGILVAGVAPAFIKGLVAAHQTSIISETAHYTAADYIQDGLVAQWDGVENVGWDSHDASAKQWVDLQRLNGTKANIRAGYWVDNAFVATNWNNLGNAKYFSYPYPTNFTFEVCIRIESLVYGPSSGTDIVVFQWRSKSNGPFRISGAWNRVFIETFGVSSSMPKYEITQYLGKDFFATLSNTEEDGGLYVNGDLQLTGYRAYGADMQYNMRIGKGGQDELKIHSIRIYDRTLSDAEVKYNNRIDRVRFR